MNKIKSIKKYCKNFAIDCVPESIVQYFQILKSRKLFLKNGIIFIHIPRNSGTSVSESLYSSKIGHFSAQKFKNIFPKTYNNNISFAVIRDPLERIESSFYYVKNIIEGNSLYNNGLRRKHRYSKFGSFSFEEFVTEWLPGANIEAEDHVFRSQSSYICKENGDIIVDYLVPIEKSEISCLIKLISGLEITVTHINTSKREHETSIITDKMREIIKYKYENDYHIYDKYIKNRNFSKIEDNIKIEL